MVEKDIEKRIIDKINGLGIKDMGVYGLWQDGNTMLNNKELPNQKAILVVKVPTRGFDSFGICEVQFDINISLVVRLEMCPDGMPIEQIVEPIMKMLTDWNLVQRYEELEDFMVDGFYPGGIQVNQGQGPDIDTKANTWSTTFNLVLRGTVGCGCQP